MEGRRPDQVGRQTVLFLTADTGGGHRAATDAISQALDRRYPNVFVAEVCDPLTGPDTHRLIRRVCRLYGPVTRRTPWLWSMIFYGTNTPAARPILRRVLRQLVAEQIAESFPRHQPVVVVCVHPLLVSAAVSARKGSLHQPPVVTVVTDLGTAHGAWWHKQVDRTITPSDKLLRAGRKAGAANLYGESLGIPVREQFTTAGVTGLRDKARLREELGIRPNRFVVLVTAGAEGGRGLRAWSRALAAGVPGVDVVAVCGRDEASRAELSEYAAGLDGRLIVTGLVTNMPDWIRCADVVVSKAGPSIIAEATSVGVPLVLPSHLPGQEAGNTELAVAAGAARRVRGRQQLVREVDRLRQDTVAMAAMRAAAVRFGRPQAALRIAELVADQAWAKTLPPVTTGLGGSS